MTIKSCNYAEENGISGCFECDNRYTCKREKNTKYGKANEIIWLNNQEVEKIEMTIKRMRRMGMIFWTVEDMKTICKLAKNDLNLCKTEKEEYELTTRSAWTLGYEIRNYTRLEKIEMEKHSITGTTADGHKYCTKCGLYEEYCDHPCVAQKK